MVNKVVADFIDIDQFSCHVSCFADEQNPFFQLPGIGEVNNNAGQVNVRIICHILVVGLRGAFGLVVFVTTKPEAFDCFQYRVTLPVQPCQQLAAFLFQSFQRNFGLPKPVCQSKSLIM